MFHNCPMRHFIIVVLNSLAENANISILLMLAGIDIFPYLGSGITSMDIQLIRLQNNLNPLLRLSLNNSVMRGGYCFRREQDQLPCYPSTVKWEGILTDGGRGGAASKRGRVWILPAGPGQHLLPGRIVSLHRTIKSTGFTTAGEEKGLFLLLEWKSKLFR